MEEFEYGVDICDRDWTSFVAECEECDLLPPTLAGLDDSGMSDLDDKVRFVQKVELAALGEDSPADRYLSKHGVTGMESILSGSEEDIHLQSVNVFFERLKSAAEAEKLAEAPTGGEVEPEAWRRRGGPRANGPVLMENVPNGDFPAAAEATEPDNFTSSMVETGRGGDGVPTSPAGGTAAFRSSEPEPVLSSSDAEEKAAELCTPLIIIEEEQFPPTKGYSNAPPSHLDAKWKTDTSASPPDSTDAGKAASQESSPSSSVRRKRTRKRRPEPAFVKPSDSEEEQQARRGGAGVRVETPRHAASISSLPLRTVGERSAIPLSQTVVSALSRSGLLATRSHLSRSLHIDQEMIHMFCCESEQQHQRSSSQTLTRSADPLQAPGAGNSNGSRVGQSSDPSSTSSNQRSTSGMERAKSTPDICVSLPGNRCPSPQRPSSHAHGPAPELPPFSDLEVLSGRSAAAKRARAAPPPIPPELLQVCKRSLSSLSEFTPVSSCCTLDTESGMSLSNGNITDLSYSSCLTVSQSESRCSGGKTSPTKQEEDEEKEEKEEEEEEESSVPEPDDVTAAPEELERAPDSTHSVFAMSSFWSEMERLTINDILGLRKMEQAASQSSLPPSQERRKPAEFALTDSGLRAEELQPGRTGTPVPLPERPRADGYHRTAITGGRGLDSGTAVRRICKTVSTQDLRALESVRSGREKQALPRLDEDDLESAGCFPDGPPPEKEGSYSISLGGMFRYVLGKQSHPPCYPGNTGGPCLPETYDYFMSDCDAVTSFHPSVSAQGRAKDGCRSAGRTLQFPEAYEYFFASSSSDESDEEEDGGPVRAASRLRRTSTSSELSTDIYDNFFTECDLEQSFFGTNFFTNLLFTGSTEKRPAVSGSVVPQRPRGLQITVNPTAALENQEWVFSDLRPVEDGLSYMPPRHLSTCMDLQVAVPSPRLDAPLLALGQSDMCLVCIAFASWVLKTANPQVGDAWKAVLLANVSALSAIRYLRKYVKDPSASEQMMLLDS